MTYIPNVSHSCLIARINAQNTQCFLDLRRNTEESRRQRSQRDLILIADQSYLTAGQQVGQGTTALQRRSTHSHHSRYRLGVQGKQHMICARVLEFQINVRIGEEWRTSTIAKCRMVISQLHQLSDIVFQIQLCCRGRKSGRHILDLGIGARDMIITLPHRRAISRDLVSKTR